jgi:hypothetical protein
MGLAGRGSTSSGGFGALPATVPSPRSPRSFVMGTSSTLFNAGLLTLNGTNSDSVIVDAIQSVLSSLSANENDVALYPNSFANWTPQPNPVSAIHTTL